MQRRPARYDYRLALITVLLEPSLDVRSDKLPHLGAAAVLHDRPKHPRNAVAQGITIYRLEIELEGDLNITGVWGTGDLSEKPVGFTDVRAKITLDADRPREELAALIAHAKVWSPVANTFTRPVKLDVEMA